MEIPVSAQALTFAQGALLGLGLCLAYDLLRALRQLCPRTGLAADALFGLLLTASFLSFALTAGAAARAASAKSAPAGGKASGIRAAQTG